MYRDLILYHIYIITSPSSRQSASMIIYVAEKPAHTLSGFPGARIAKKPALGVWLLEGSGDLQGRPA